MKLQSNMGVRSNAKVVVHNGEWEGRLNGVTWKVGFERDRQREKEREREQRER